MSRPSERVRTRRVSATDFPLCDFDPRAVERLLEGLSAPSRETTGARMGEISRRLLGAPYRIEPLGGAPGQVENLAVSVAFFDCVTFVEHVFALALSSTPAEFPENVRRLRYRRGRVTWSDRNHYMTSWIRNNVRDGSVRDLLGSAPFVRNRVARVRHLDVVEGIPPRSVEVRGMAKKDFLERGPVLETGDLLFFMSTRRHLDVFHVGLVVAAGPGRTADCALRHASRSRGRVVEQTLGSFTTANRMSGILAVRPSIP